MYRFLTFSLLFLLVQTSLGQTQPAEVVRVDAEPEAVTEISSDTTVNNDSSFTVEENVTTAKPAKDSKSDDDEVDKESLGYKIGYQIGSWLIPGILMVIVTIMIFRRSRRGGERPEL